MNSIITYFFLFIILVISIVIPMLYSNISWIEPFTNLEDFNEYQNYGNYPDAENTVLLGDSFPITHKNGVSEFQEQKMWWHYPIFKVGSFAQHTNNLKYPNNPDNGTSTAAEFSGTLYKEYQAQTNVATVLPPVPITRAARVNYYNTSENLQNYRSKIANILY